MDDFIKGNFQTPTFINLEHENMEINELPQPQAQQLAELLGRVTEWKVKKLTIRKTKISNILDILRRIKFPALE